MDARCLERDTGFLVDRATLEGGLIDALRRERRHAAVVYLTTGMALGIGFALALDMIVSTSARL